MAFYAPEDTMRANPLSALDAEAVRRVESIKLFGQQLYDYFGELPQSADMTLAKRRVEEAVMWAVKAVTA